MISSGPGTPIVVIVDPLASLSIPLLGEEYKNFGRMTAWRVTLWEGAHLLGMQQSFLW